MFKLKFISPDNKEIADSHGWVDFSREIIALNPDQSPESLHDTFLHELIHAVCYVMSIKMEEGDEQMTRRLATGLCTVWKEVYLCCCIPLLNCDTMYKLELVVFAALKILVLL